MLRRRLLPAVLISAALTLPVACAGGGDVAGVAPAGGTEGPAVTAAAPAAFSPNGDGIKDTAAVSVTLGQAVLLTVEAHGPGGVETILPARFAEAGETAFRWDGRGGSGQRLADGAYTIVVHALDATGASASAEARLRLDTTPPRVTWTSVAERPGAGPLRTRFRVADRGATRVTLLVSGRDGQPWQSGTRAAGPGAAQVAWALRGRGGGKLAPGGYRVSLRAVDDVGNAATSRVRPVLVSYPVTTRVIRRVEGAGRRVALTFDDCNDGAAWARILDILAARDVHATFFCLGPLVAAHPAQARRTVREGHSIGNHSWRHPHLPSLSEWAVRSELERAGEPWWSLARTSPLPLFRPPYGALGSSVLAGAGAAGYRLTVLWDVDPQDWRRPGASVIAARSVGPARRGSIVVLHVQAQTAAALPAILAGLARKGLRPVSLDELLRAGGYAQSRVTVSQNASPAQGP